MTSKTEELLSKALRAVLTDLPDGASIGESDGFREFQEALEFFLPAELGWDDESFDAFRFILARKVALDEAEFLGLGLLISDQCWTPIRLRLRLSSSSDQVATLDCRVGEPGDGTAGLVRIPYGSSAAEKCLFGLSERSRAILWVYRAARE